MATSISTFFGVGRAPVAPGTVASLVGLLLAWPISAYFGQWALLAAGLVAYGAGIWATGTYARRGNKEDPSECVIDEVAGQWIACAASPLTLPAYAAAFALFRLFDISKLWPVSFGEKLPGGWGIMTDDLIAGLLTALIIAAARWQGIF
ncbi:MAG: phosphatidylglycerophosphatase A [Proteobacteria bacterium]|nr:phosphatidylglycerophosphatase A [Pseudomonadota bacterium]